MQFVSIHKGATYRSNTNMSFVTRITGQLYVKLLSAPDVSRISDYSAMHKMNCCALHFNLLQRFSYGKENYRNGHIRDCCFEFDLNFINHEIKTFVSNKTWNMEKDLLLYSSSERCFSVDLKSTFFYCFSSLKLSVSNCNNTLAQETFILIYVRFSL